jgi:2-polyprenyl-3-methyl-5-hydroxy-6-metoxy-1,4-benzoquinol methylase
MVPSRRARNQVLRLSKQYYSRRAYYLDLLSQRRPADKGTSRELSFLEFAFKKKATRRVPQVLDVACGGGRHVVGLAQRGYQCTGQDFTPERVDITKAAPPDPASQLNSGREMLQSFSFRESLTQSWP